MLTFRQFIKESIDDTAGVEFGAGEKAVKYKYKVSELINHAQKKDKHEKDKYPVQHINPNSMADNIEAGKDSETEESARKRTDKADTSYPIIVTPRSDGTLHILDGRHRLRRALENNHPTIPTRIIPGEHLKKFRTLKKV